MKLDLLLNKVDVLDIIGDTNIEISNIQLDSRNISKGEMFIALAGTQKSGDEFIQSAIVNGAKAIICHNTPSTCSENVTYILVNDSNDALSVVSNNFYDFPSKKIEIIGVTGTNGKTSIVSLLHQLFSIRGYKCGLISTIENIIDQEKYISTHTTPDILQINFLLSKMVELGCSYCFMEVSSHALDQNRIKGLNFKIAVFTNITHDHLDYHKSFKNYLNTKKSFFDNLEKTAIALINRDDKNADVMMQNSLAKKYTYSLQSISDYKCKIIESDFDGMLLELDNYKIWVKLVGKFNAYNLLAVYSVSKLLEGDTDEILQALSIVSSAKGRFQTLKSVNNIVFIIDYAHTEDALQNVLSTINSIRKKNQNLITVFGCGGDRDRLKRPLMTNVACKLSSQVIITSDNPRNENIRDIISDMLTGISEQNIEKTIVINDRKQAIKTAFRLAKSNDIILVAGKGHEKFQEVSEVKIPFDDKQEILKLINKNIN
jgi:UDP-N-acetylmuramoyl-L-alanyl-D-glutamate--2,6-diaminopimelate ligase